MSESTVGRNNKLSIAITLKVSQFIRDHFDRYAREKWSPFKIAAEATEKLETPVSDSNVEHILKAMSLKLPRPERQLAPEGSRKARERIARRTWKATSDRIDAMNARLDGLKIDDSTTSRILHLEQVVTTLNERMKAAEEAVLTLRSSHVKFVRRLADVIDGVKALARDLGSEHIVSKLTAVPESVLLNTKPPATM